MKSLAILGACLMLGACAAPSAQQQQQQQRFDHAYINQHLISGKTTSADLLNRFGSPNSRELSSGGEERWIYSKPQGSAGNTQSLFEMLPSSMQRRLVQKMAQSEYGTDALSMADSLLSDQPDAAGSVDSLTIYLKQGVVTRFSY